MSNYGGQKTPSLMGSKQSVYSHTSSTVRAFRTGNILKILYAFTFCKKKNIKKFQGLNHTNMENIASKNGGKDPL